MECILNMIDDTQGIVFEESCRVVSNEAEVSVLAEEAHTSLTRGRTDRGRVRISSLSLHTVSTSEV